MLQIYTLIIYKYDYSFQMFLNCILFISFLSFEILKIIIPSMYAVIDTNIIINRQLDDYKFERGFITPSVLKEITIAETRNYFDLYTFKIEVKEPCEKYVLKVEKLQKEKNLLLSKADVDIVALTLEIKDNLNKEMFDKWITKENIKNQILCITKDNGVLQCLNYFNQQTNIQNRNYLFRCSSCFSLYESKLDFCKKCASNLISRVSFKNKNGKIFVFLKKGYIRNNKVLKDKYGNILRSADQKEYINHLKEIKKSTN